jgi:hypothetical protein
MGGRRRRRRKKGRRKSKEDEHTLSTVEFTTLAYFQTVFAEETVVNLDCMSGSE